MENFLLVLRHYLIEVVPAVLFGFLLSGIIHEYIPMAWVEKYLGARGIKPIFYATLVGTFLPVCCWGSLPIAVSFYKKGSRLGPILAFLVATPATSVTALFVSYKLLGPGFTVYIFFSVIIMGMITGILGNFFGFKPKKQKKDVCPHCEKEQQHCAHKPGFGSRIKSILKFAFWDMPKELGMEILIGLVLAAAVGAFLPIGHFIKTYLAGTWAYLFSLVFGLLMYFCSTASVPLVDALIKQGMSGGAGLVLLLVGPITSYGTILVLRKEFGAKVLSFYLASISVLALGLGFLFSLIYR
ncbi:MAG: permease [Candidatus Omnitrophota bacterium]